MVVVDLGARTSDVVILSMGEPVFARTLSQGSERIETTAPLLAREIRLTIGAFRSLGGAAPERVYLCGGGSTRPGAHTFLAERARPAVPELRRPRSSRPGQSDRSARRGRRGSPRRSGSRSAWARGPSTWTSEGAPGVRARLRLGSRQDPGPRRARDGRPRQLPVLRVGAAARRSPDHDNLEKALASGDEGRPRRGDDQRRTRQRARWRSRRPSATDDPLPHADAFDVMVKLSDDIPPT